MPRPIRALIDVKALQYNLQCARACAGQARIWSVLKADAYGHGLLNAANGLAATDGFAVLDYADAVRLREAGFAQPVLMLEGFFDSHDLALCAELNLTPVLHTLEQVECLAIGAPVPAAVYVKVNSGMNRLGVRPNDVPAVLRRIGNIAGITSAVLMTHFATADTPAGIDGQFAVFQSAWRHVALSACLANSAALLRYPQARSDWVRPGIMLYGGSPFADKSAAQCGLRPVMTLASELIAVQELRVGATVGYGATFVAPKRMRVGVVACGYADGYPRHAPNGTPVLVDGRRLRLVGRVSMDMLCVDLTELPQVHVGTPVVLWGSGLPVEEVARTGGTIAYETLSAVTARVPRIVV